MREPIRDKERLEHMLESIDRIQKNVADLDWEHIRENEIFYYGLVKNIEIIGEAAYHLTKEFREANVEIPWNLIIRMRHILVHDYYQIDEKEVQYVIEDNLLPLRNQIVSCISNTDWETWERQEITPTESAVHKNMVQSASRMLSKGYSAKEISEITGLSFEEISML
jgi:uncharacterized protein with HEPN domain